MTEDEIRAEFEKFMLSLGYSTKRYSPSVDGRMYADYDTNNDWAAYFSGAQMAIKKMGEKK